MLKLTVGLATAAAALAFASPAAAQFYPQPAYGYGGGYNSGWGQARALQARIDGLQRQIDFLARHGQLRGGSANHLVEETRMLEWRLRSASRNGLNPYEAQDVRYRLSLIEQRVQYAAANGYGYGSRGWNGAGYYSDRDRDGPYDRYDNDRFDRDD